MSSEVKSEHVQIGLGHFRSDHATSTRSCQEMSGDVRTGQMKERSGQIWSGKGQHKTFLVILGQISSR